jgi:hypothetical protein
LLSGIFPWAEDAQREYQERIADDPSGNHEDLSLLGYLELMMWFRSIVIQDAAVLWRKHPDSALFEFPPFSTESFQNYAADFEGRMDVILTTRQTEMVHLPQAIADQLAASFGVLTARTIRRDKALLDRFDQLSSQFVTLKDMFENSILDRGRRRRKSFTASDDGEEEPVSDRRCKILPGFIRYNVT